MQNNLESLKIACGKYGWTTEELPKKGKERSTEVKLINRNGVNPVNAKISQNGRYWFLYPGTHTVLLVGRGQIAHSTDTVLRKHFYCKANV